MSGLETSAHWFGPPGRPLLGWLSAPDDGASRAGVVLLPPVGYEYWSSHHAMRALAERLAGRGYTVLRIDYDGTGDSAGERWEADRPAAWRRSVTLAVRALRARGLETISLVGLRLGATLALLEGAECGADAVVAWIPVVSGKRFTREVKLLALPVPGREAWVFAGAGFTAETMGEIATWDAEKLEVAPARRVFLLPRPDRPVVTLAASLERLGSRCTVQALEGSERMLEVPAEEAVVPTAQLEAIVSWLGDPPRGEPRSVAPVVGAEIPWKAGRISEAGISLGGRGLVGVLGRPLAPGPAPTVVFLNSGSEHHVGPGRAWVEYARELNLRGYPTVRLDFSGWGESGDAERNPGRPYDVHCVPEAVMAVQALRDAGHARVVLLGLCAGAWVGMRAALDAPIDGVVAINPQLYWQPGDPVEALISTTRERRTGERKRIERGRRAHLWSALDFLGIRPGAARWLSALRRRRVPTLMLFAAGDDGIEYLRGRIGRRLAREIRSGVIQVEEIPDIDHQMYREWRRDGVVGAILRFLDRYYP